MTCVCVWLGAEWVDRREGEWIRGLGLGFNQSCKNRGGVGCRLRGWFGLISLIL